MSKNISYDTHGVKWHKLLDGSIILTLPSLTFLVDPMDSEGNVLLKRNKTSAKKRMPAQFVYDYVYNDLKTNHKEHEKMWSEDKAKVFRNAPATSKQIDLIKKLDPKFSDFTKLSCADATAIITNLLYNKKGANNAS